MRRRWTASWRAFSRKSSLRAWSLRIGSARLRVAYGLYALCAVAFVAYLAFWNLTGFNY